MNQNAIPQYIMTISFPVENAGKVSPESLVPTPNPDRPSSSTPRDLLQLQRMQWGISSDNNIDTPILFLL